MEKIYDIVVVGGGPAGLTAALYGLRNGKSVTIVEKDVFGGQIANSPRVENIPGFESISGDEFGDLMLNQVIKQGGEATFDKVTGIESEGELLKVNLEYNGYLLGKTAILATGTKHRSLGLLNEDRLIGKNVHFCAVCDGSFYKDKIVVMVGGGNSAFVEANLLVDTVGKLIMLQDMPYFTADKKNQEALFSKGNVETHVNCKILEYLMADGNFIGLRYSENGVEKIVQCDGVFLAVGLIPDNKAFENQVDLDERGYFKSDEFGYTKAPNIFVAGDCRAKRLRQVATACGDGANAAIAACEYLG